MRRGQSEGLVLTLYKLVKPKMDPFNPTFIMWGSLDYLHIQEIEALATLSKENKHLPEVLDYRKIYLFNRGLSASNKNMSDIFSSDNSFPLIVVCLMKTSNLKKLRRAILRLTLSANTKFQLFETLSYGNAAIVFRSNTYEEIINHILRINTFCTNTYSISGVQYQKGKNFQNKSSNFQFKSLKAERVTFTVKYVLNDSNPLHNRALKIKDEVANIFTRFKRKYVRSKGSDLSLDFFYELGQYDVELKFSGNFRAAMEILLNPGYGLANVTSKFYKKLIFNSKTIWQLSSELKQSSK